MKSEIPKTRTLKSIRDEGYPSQKWIVDLLIPERGITILGGIRGW